MKNNTDMSAEGFAKDIVESYKPCDFPLYAFYSYMALLKDGEYRNFVKILSNILTDILNGLPNPEWHIVTLHTTLYQLLI